MKRNFTKSCLQINVARALRVNDGTQLVLTIGSDYSNSQHKGRIYPDKKRLAETVETFWESTG